MDDNRLASIERRLDRLEERLNDIAEWASDRHSYHPQATSAPDVRQETAPPALPTIEPPALPTVEPPAVTPPVAAAAEVRARPAPTEAPEQAAPRPAQTAPAVPAPPAWSLSDLEQLLSGRGLAWVGGLAILLGAIFFLGLAFTRGWIGPAGRVGIGLVVGAALVAGGAWFFERREALFGHVLTAVGLGVVSTALVAATRLYDLIPPEVGLGAALVTAVAAAIVAIRADSQVVAAYGLVTALAAPPLLGADPSLTTIGFLAAALVGTTTISLFRAWAWLPPLAFLLSAPQLWAWIVDGPPLASGLLVVAGFWLLHALAAGGEEFRTRRHRLHATSASLFQANAVFVVVAGFALLGAHDAEGGRGLFLLLTALAHFALAGYFLVAEGDRHPFGLLAAGTGVTVLTIAVPVQFGGPAVPIAWAAEAAALAWVYSWRRHWTGGLAAAVLGALSIAHLLTFEYSPLDLLLGRTESATPFLNGSAGTLACILVALAAAGAFVRSRALATALATVGVLLVTYALPFELSGLALLTGWAAVFVLTIALGRAVDLLSGGWMAPDQADAPADVVVQAFYGLHGPALIAAALAVAHLTTVELPMLGSVRLPATPFADRGTAGTAILIVASLLGGWIAGTPLARRLGIVAAFALAHYLVPFEVPAAATVVLWSALAVALFALPRWDGGGRTLYLGAAVALVGLALLKVLGDVAPPERLVVHARSTIDHPLFWSGATAALGALVGALAVAAWLHRADRRARWLAFLAAALAVYLLSVGVVDEFQRRVGPGIDRASLQALQKQAQVALSILWAALGGAAFVTGVVRWVTPVRLAGLALLALATTKVFLYDLASLDATYKVASFIGLGVLLLVSSYAYQRLKPQLARPDDPETSPPGSTAGQRDSDATVASPNEATMSP